MREREQLHSGNGKKLHFTGSEIKSNTVRPKKSAKNEYMC